METRAPTHEDYLAAGRGELSAEEFKAALPHATAAVRDLIFPNEPDGSEEWARAVMAACEVDAAYGCSGGIMEGGGFTVGSFSWNPGTKGSAPTAATWRPPSAASCLERRCSTRASGVPDDAGAALGAALHHVRQGAQGGRLRAASSSSPSRCAACVFEPVSAWLVREYALGDGAQGLVIADGADSPGMFDVPVGSRVSIDGGEWMNVARCTPRRAFGTRPHHWELEVR